VTVQQHKVSKKGLEIAEIVKAMPRLPAQKKFFKLKLKRHRTC